MIRSLAYAGALGMGALAACAAPPAGTSASPGPMLAEGIVFVANVAAVADRLPPGDPESSCTGEVTLMLDPTLRGPLKLATARFDVRLSNCAADTVVTDMHVHRGSDTNLAIDATVKPMTLTNGGGSGTFTNPGVKPTVIDDIVADTTTFYVNLHSKRHPNGVMRGDLRRS